MGEVAFETVIELLNDEQARTILEATSIEPLSAGELTEWCDTSQQTVYRRLERLQEVGLLDDQTRVREDGHHETVYTATLEHVSITLRDGSLQFDIERTKSEAADQLTELWRSF